MTAKVRRSALVGVDREKNSSDYKTRAGKLKSIWKWLRAELRATRPVFFFFLSGFLLVLLIVKLALAEYSIGVNALSHAVLGAVLAAKVVLILERTPMARPFRQLPRIVPISFKSLFYGASVILLGFVERIVDALRHAPTILDGLDEALASVNLHRLLSVALGVTIVFGIYFIFSEIEEFMGADLLAGFLLKRRPP